MRRKTKVDGEPGDYARLSDASKASLKVIKAETRRSYVQIVEDALGDYERNLTGQSGPQIFHSTESSDSLSLLSELEDLEDFLSDVIDRVRRGANPPPEKPGGEMLEDGVEETRGVGRIRARFTRKRAN